MKSYRLIIAVLWGFALLLFGFLLEPLHHEGTKVLLALGGMFAATSALGWLLFITRRREQAEALTLERAGLVKYRYGVRSGGLAYSAGVEQLVGWPVSDLLQNPRRWAESIHPEDAPRIAALLGELPAGELFSLEYRIRHADGRWIWVLDRAVNIDRSGADIVVDGIAIDITARKEAEIAVSNREHDWAQLIEQLPVMIFVKDAQTGRYLRSNAAYERGTGIPMAGLLGKSDQELWPDAEVLAAQDAEVIARQGVLEIPAERVQTHLGERWLYSRKVCLRDERSEPRFILGMSLDITEEYSLRHRLDAERAQMRNLLDAIPDMVGLKDQYGIYREVNAALAAFIGRERHEILGNSDRDLFPLDTAEIAVRYDEQVLLTGRGNRHTERRVSTNGQTLSFDVVKHPLFDAQHNVSGVVAIARDISVAESAERERSRLLEELAGARVAQARAEVSTAESRGRQLIQALSEAVVSIDRQGRVTLFNAAAEKLFGWTEAEVVGRGYHELVHHTRADGRPYPADTCELLKTMRTERKTIHGTDTFWRRDGRPFTGEYSYLPLLEDGEATSAVVVTRDVTERERSAQRLRMLSRVVEEGPAAVAMTDASGVIHYVNQRFTEMTGYSETATIGKTHAMLSSGRTPREVYEAMWAALNAGNAWAGDLQNRRRDGRPYWQHSLIMPLKDGAGKLTHYLAISEDITERRELEAKERASRERLERTLVDLGAAKVAAEAAAVAKSQFLANVSHEIRTPMNAILGLTELTLRTSLDQLQRNYLEKSYRSARLLLALLSDVLDFSKIEAGRLTLELQPFRIDDLVDQVVDLLGETAAEKDLEFVVDLDPDLPPVLIGDMMRLTQVVTNLLSNAIKFTERGEVVLRLRQLPAVQPGQVSLAIGVADTGIGMTPEQSTRAFEAFAQGDGSSTRRYGGTGLGLTISRYLVELMDSRLQVETSLGAGSHFHFVVSLPAGDSVQRGNDPLRPLSGATTLVLAAHPLQRLAVDRLLQGMGARSMTAASVADALAACRDSADRSTSPLRLVVADEGLLDDPSLVEWIKRLRTTPGSGPLDLVLMWRKQANLPSDLPPHQMLGRPLTRHGLLRVIQGLRGAPGEHPASLLASNSRLAGARILIVDDYALNLEIVTTFLTDAGCVVATAANGAEAVDHVARNPVDAVLMDCQMPVMDGFDATRAIRQRKECQALPIIAMTANVLEADRDQCFAAGMNDFLGKPVMFEKLLEVLVKHLPAQRAVAAVADVVAVAPVASQAPATAPTVDFTRLQRIDVEAALATTMGKPEFLVRVLRIFVTTQTGFDAKFVAAQADPSDPEAAGRAAHTLKGAAASICAEPLRQAALALEQAAKQGLPQAEVKQRLDAVQVELEPVLEGIRQALSI